MMLRRWRVRRGIKFLDRHVTREVWLGRVDVDGLSTCSGDNCPLAQATADGFWHATRVLGFTGSWRDDVRLMLLGFLNVPGESWADLDVAWRAALTPLVEARRDVPVRA